MDSFFAVVIVVMLALALPAFWILQLIHVLKSHNADKLVWVIVMIFLGPFGSAIYFFVGRKVSSNQALETNSQ